MHVVTLVAPVFGTNCYLVFAGESGPCVIVDPGGGVGPAVRAAVEEYGLEPRLVLATHGHVDHTWSAAELCELYEVKLSLHAADVYRLTDPFSTLEASNRSQLASGPLGQALTAAGCPPADYRTPTRVEQFDGRRTRLEVGGLVIEALHAPGHTQGSTIYTFAAQADPASVLPAGGGGLRGDSGRTALTGDVLFAGTIGRTDLPGGDGDVMRATLRDVVARITPDTLVLPGHGPATRMDVELVTNPFLLRR